LRAEKEGTFKKKRKKETGPCSKGGVDQGQQSQEEDLGGENRRGTLDLSGKVE